MHKEIAHTAATQSGSGVPAAVDLSVPPGQVKQIYLLPSATTGTLIGPRGATISELREKAGCTIKITEGAPTVPGFTANYREIHVVGPEPTVAAAVALIRATLGGKADELLSSMDKPPAKELKADSITFISFKRGNEQVPAGSRLLGCRLLQRARGYRHTICVVSTWGSVVASRRR